MSAPAAAAAAHSLGSSVSICCEKYSSASNTSVAATPRVGEIIPRVDARNFRSIDRIQGTSVSRLSAYAKMFSSWMRMLTNLGKSDLRVIITSAAAYLLAFSYNSFI